MEMNAPFEGPCVFAGQRFNVFSAELPGRDGSVVMRDAVVCPNSVIVLPVLPNGDLVLIRNERFAVGETLWEVCAGTMEMGEEPVECAKREVVEETGYRAGRLEPLLHFWAAPGLCTEHMHAFIARDLEHVGQQLDENERIDVEVLPCNRAIQLIRDGDIQDGKSIATLLYYQTFVLQC